MDSAIQTCKANILLTELSPKHLNLFLLLYVLFGSFVFFFSLNTISTKTSIKVGCFRVAKPESLKAFLALRRPHVYQLS